MKKTTTTFCRYPTLDLPNFDGGVSCGRLEIGYQISNRKPTSKNNYYESHHRCLDTLTSSNYNNSGRHHIRKKVCCRSRCVGESKWKVSWVINIKNHCPWVGNIVIACIKWSIVPNLCW